VKQEEDCTGKQEEPTQCNQKSVSGLIVWKNIGDNPTTCTLKGGDRPAMGKWKRGERTEDRIPAKAQCISAVFAQSGGGDRAFHRIRKETRAVKKAELGRWTSQRTGGEGSPRPDRIFPETVSLRGEPRRWQGKTPAQRCILKKKQVSGALVKKGGRTAGVARATKTETGIHIDRSGNPRKPGTPNEMPGEFKNTTFVKRPWQSKSGERKESHN